MENQFSLLSDSTDLNQLNEIIAKAQPADIAEAIHDLREDNQKEIFNIIPIKKAVAVFEFLDFDIKKNLINKLDHER
ncbi:MAG TPA: hypothetical protein VNW99_09655, partial [Cytophagaceae bacterium]|nr:hypothetical protein [Cytophagaceae bacterium]